MNLAAFHRFAEDVAITPRRGSDERGVEHRATQRFIVGVLSETSLGLYAVRGACRCLSGKVTQVVP